MAKVKIVYEKDGILNFLKANKPIRDMMMHTGMAVQANAQATAQSAQNGPGTTIDGNADAGCATVWEQRGKRPRVVVKSLAPAETATAAHFYTQKRDGVAHMRAALYKETNRG